LLLLLLVLLWLLLLVLHRVREVHRIDASERILVHALRIHGLRRRGGHGNGRRTHGWVRWYSRMPTHSHPIHPHPHPGIHASRRIANVHSGRATPESSLLLLLYEIVLSLLLHQMRRWRGLHRPGTRGPHAHRASLRVSVRYARLLHIWLHLTPYMSLSRHLTGLSTHVVGRRRRLYLRHLVLLLHLPLLLLHLVLLECPQNTGLLLRRHRPKIGYFRMQELDALMHMRIPNHVEELRKDGSGDRTRYTAEPRRLGARVPILDLTWLRRRIWVRLGRTTVHRHGLRRGVASCTS